MKSNLTPALVDAMAEHHAQRSQHTPAEFFQALDENIAKHKAAGFVTVHDAAIRLADDDESLRKAYHLAMCEAWATGKLPAYDGDIRAPLEAPTLEERQRLKGWEALGPSGMRQRLDPNRTVQRLDLVKVSELDAWLRLAGRTFPYLAPAQPNSIHPVTRSAAQENAILHAITSAGHDPRAIDRRAHV